MNIELLSRLFRAIAKVNKDIDLDETIGVCEIIIKEEEKMGHVNNADKLRDILKKRSRANSRFSGNSHCFKSLEPLPISSRIDSSLISIIPRENLKHNFVFNSDIQEMLIKIQCEYAARDQLADQGFSYGSKILLYGPSGCGKTLAAQLLALNLGITFCKVRFDALISSYLGETSKNLRSLFDYIAQNKVLLFFDEFDSIASSRKNNGEVREITRVTNMFLQLLDEFIPGDSLIVAATNLNESLDLAVWRRFDYTLHITRPHRDQVYQLVKMYLRRFSEFINSVQIGDFVDILYSNPNLSAADVKKIVESAAKATILRNDDNLITDNLRAEIKKFNPS